MTADETRKEIVRELELDYEKTTKALEGVVSSSFTVRGWGITLSSALIGFAFQNKLWQLSALAVIVILLIALVDGYHSWLYSKVLQHANNIETIMRYYYAYLARGDVDPQPLKDFLIRIDSHRFGRYSEINKKFSLADLRDARPRLVLVTLYGTLVACALTSGVLVYAASKKAAAASTTNLDCTPVAAGANVYVCKPK
jgi:hypothetical protein